MEFRLIYKGKLPAEGRGGGGGRNAEKHEVRLRVHEQLKTLWREHPSLRGFGLPMAVPRQSASGPRTQADNIADDFQRCNMRFLPIVNSKYGLACALDILFLRRDPPGSAIITGGDIDNRIKVLLDGLKMPRECSQIPSGWKPGPEHDPLYCLMEDDNLITELRVTTDRLITPMEQDEERNDVVLIIHVTTKIVDHNTAYIEMG